MDTPGRPPVQRLGSINTSRSASPAVRRGISSRGKKAPIKPTFTGRRSKEEREALEKEALERERARNAERQRRDEKRQMHLENMKKREANRALRGRGGYSSAMSGPFSLGSSREGMYLCDVHGGFTDMIPRPQSQPPVKYHSRLGFRLTGHAHQRRGRRMECGWQWERRWWRQLRL